MRSALAMALAITMSTAGAAVWAQNAPAPAAAPAPADGRRAGSRRRAGPAPKPTIAKCDNPNALGVERIVQIDTTGGPGFGFEHFKAYDFLRDHEVVLTFDDGPWPGNTERVLKALADNCTKALFFPIGKHSGWHPEILKEVAEGRPHHRLAHLVAQGSHQADAGRGQGRDRKGHRGGEHRARQQAGRSVLPLPGAAQPARDGQISRRAQYRHLLHRHGLVRLQDSQARAGHQIGHDQARASTAKASS